MTTPASVSEGLATYGAPTGQAELWLRRYHPASAPGAAPRLVCCPHSGGAASYYRPLSAALSPNVEVLAVQYPGRQDRRAEPLIGDLRELAGRLADVLAGELGDEPERPVALFGHSMGALLAFEVAQRLERGGRAVSALFVSGHRAPTTRRDVLFHRADDKELLREVRRLGGTDADLLDDDEIVQLALPVIRCDTRAAETYRVDAGQQPELRCPVVALIGTEDPQVDAAEADKWREHTSGHFELRAFPGGHFYLNSYTAELSRLIGTRLSGGL